MRTFDLDGLPDEVVAEAREILGEAEIALRRDSDLAAGRDAIQRALVMW